MKLISDKCSFSLWWLHLSSSSSSTKNSLLSSKGWTNSANIQTKLEAHTAQKRSTKHFHRPAFSCDHKYFTSKGNFINQTSSLFATFQISPFFCLFPTLHNKGIFSLYGDYELFIKMGAKEDFSFLLFLRWEESEGKSWVRKSLS